MAYGLKYSITEVIMHWLVNNKRVAVAFGSPSLKKKINNIKHNTMKRNLFLGLAVALACFVTVSCVESSGKYKALVAQRDSLLSESVRLEADYNETMDILNDVENGFASIREKEGMIRNDLSNVEGKSASKKQQVAGDVAQIKELIEQNKAKIAQLEARLSKSGKDNKTLKVTIERLQKELDEKSELVAALSDELAKKNIKIDELTGTVNKLNTDLSEMSETSKKQMETIQAQDEDLNKVWYCVANQKTLKEAGIVTKNGLFGKKKLMDGDFDSKLFVKADKRELKSIPTGRKSIKILSSHPSDSYTLVKEDDQTITISITSPERFWSVSNYLVVRD